MRDIFTSLTNAHSNDFIFMPPPGKRCGGFVMSGIYTILIPDEFLSRRNIALKYFSSDQVFNELVNGEVTREVIYASMNVARKRKYAEREKLFADALARFDEYRKEKTK